MPRPVEPADNMPAFHSAEFRALKDETLDETKTAVANFRYGLVFAGAVAAWYLDKRPIPWTTHYPDYVIAWLPLLIALVLALQTWGVRDRQITKGKYFRELEREFCWGDLGWEKRWDEHNKGFLRGYRFGRAESLSWLCLFVGALVFGFIGSPVGPWLWKSFIDMFQYVLT